MLKLVCVSLEEPFITLKSLLSGFQENSQTLYKHLGKGNKALACIAFVNSSLFRIYYDSLQYYRIMFAL